MMVDNLHFADFSTRWRSEIRHSVDTSSVNDNEYHRLEKADIGNDYKIGSNAESNINDEWFRRYVGDNILVPVRTDNDRPTNNLSSNQDDLKGENNGLDEDGRAVECKTKQTKLRDWIDECKIHSQQYESNSNTTNDVQSGYLKDWHLLQYIMNKQKDHSEQPAPALSLYITPSFFERDLLNNFLQRYSDGGDYCPK